MNRTLLIFVIALSPLLNSCQLQRYSKPFLESHLEEMKTINKTLFARFDEIQDCTVIPEGFDDCPSDDHCEELTVLWHSLGLFSVCKHYIHEDSSQYAFVYSFSKKEYDDYVYKSKLIWCPDASKVDSLASYYVGGMDEHSPIDAEWTYVEW